MRAAERQLQVAEHDDDGGGGDISDTESLATDSGATARRRPRSKYERERSAYLFKYIILAQIVVYIEAGAIPALLTQLKVIFNMSYNEQGALGGVVYLFLSMACPLAGYLFRVWSPRAVLSATLSLNLLATLGFALTPDEWTKALIVSRAMIGFTQAFVMVYSPVWVDEFAPPARRTAHMSYLQGSVPIGIMVGYCFGTVVSYFEHCPWCDYQLCECWRYAHQCARIDSHTLPLPLHMSPFVY
jgi:MFS transporter, Spinster family, sphingosine-1-phosphate transporter